MRYIRDIAHPTHKISLYQWNGKYIIKFELAGLYEQIYKVDETEIIEESEVDKIVDEKFLNAVIERFKGMHQDLKDSMYRNEILF